MRKPAVTIYGNRVKLRHFAQTRNAYHFVSLLPADQSGSALESGSLIVDGLWLMLGDSSLRFTTTRETESQHDDDMGVVNTTHPNENRGNL